MHAYAHCCSHLHVFLPARENPQRLPLLHPHHNHYDYHDHDYHYHNDHNHNDYDYHSHDDYDYYHDNCYDDHNYVGCVSCGAVPCECFGRMCECACSFVGFF